MGNDIDNKSQSIHAKKAGQGRVRMAYSLNNTQPVACTIVSDQPFFYMDEEEVFEEDSIFSDLSSSDMDFMAGEFDLSEGEFSHLESEILELKDKIQAYERVSLDFVKEEDQRLQEFLTDSHFISTSTDFSSKGVLGRIQQILSQSRMATKLYDQARENGVELVISDQIKNVSYDKKSNQIFIRPDLEGTEQVLLVVQELRRHWQYRQGALVHPLTFHPDQAVLINRSQLADLNVAVIRCAWEMKLSGQNDIWARIENSSLSDLGRALAREALSDFRTLNNGKASAAVFETWFLSERCRYQDKKLIQAMLADYRGYVFDNTETSRMVSIDLICALGEQPFGKNYLASYAQMIMSDPVFTDVRDRSNANFLWFIKFERSFIETEQELQSSSENLTSGIDQMNNYHIEDTDHENDTAIIYDEHAKEALRQSIYGGSEGSNNVIHVAFRDLREAGEGISS